MSRPFRSAEDGGGYGNVERDGLSAALPVVLWRDDASLEQIAF